MSKIKELLDAKGKEYSKMNAPDDFTDRIRGTLRKENKDKRVSLKKRCAYVFVIILLLLVGIFKLDTVAVMNDRISGYDELMSENLKELNRNNYGQKVNKKYFYSDGRYVQLDGIMVDSQKLVVMFSAQMTNEEYQEGHFRSEGLTSSDKIIWRGFGTGMYYEEENLMRWERWYKIGDEVSEELSFTFTRKIEEEFEEGTIKFKIEKEKAMAPVLKKRLNKRIALQEGKIIINSIEATPMSTVIKGERKNILQLAWEKIFKSEDNISDIDVSLWADGVSINKRSSGERTDIKGKHASWDFDGIPENTEKLEIKVEDYKIVEEAEYEEEFSLGKINESISIIGEQVCFENIESKNNEVYITFISENDVLLKDVFIESKGAEFELQRTIDDDYYTENGVKYHQRTMVFEGTADEVLKLKIGKIQHRKSIDKVILIRL